MAHLDVQRAASISLAGCDACPCGSIHVRLHDANGDIFAIASIPVAVAEAFAAQLDGHLEAAEGSLSGMRCEGVA